MAVVAVAVVVVVRSPSMMCLSLPTRAEMRACWTSLWLAATHDSFAFSLRAWRHVVDSKVTPADVVDSVFLLCLVCRRREHSGAVNACALTGAYLCHFPAPLTRKGSKHTASSSVAPPSSGCPAPAVQAPAVQLLHVRDVRQHQLHLCLRGGNNTAWAWVAGAAAAAARQSHVVSTSATATTTAAAPAAFTVTVTVAVAVTVTVTVAVTDAVAVAATATVAVTVTAAVTITVTAAVTITITATAAPA